MGHSGESAFGQWLRERMAERADLNQPRLAELLGVNQSTISNWVRGRSEPASLEAIGALADIFGTEKATLLHLLGLEVGPPYQFSPALAPVIERLDKQLAAIKDPRVRQLAEAQLKDDVTRLTHLIERLSGLAAPPGEEP